MEDTMHAVVRETDLFTHSRNSIKAMTLSKNFRRVMLNAKATGGPSSCMQEEVALSD
jgi:hypothetical protein